MLTKYKGWLRFITVGLGVALLFMGCHSFHLVRDATDLTKPNRVDLNSFLSHPFVHNGTLAEFQKELPTVRPVRMLYQPSRLRTEQDTLYQFDLPNESKIILYRSAKGQERFMAATIGTAAYSLVANIHVGMPLDSLRERIDALPDFVGDTLRLVRDPEPYEVDLYFKNGVIERFQVLGRKRIQQ